MASEKRASEGRSESPWGGLFCFMASNKRKYHGGLPVLTCDALAMSVRKGEMSEGQARRTLIEYRTTVGNQLRSLAGPATGGKRAATIQAISAMKPWITLALLLVATLALARSPDEYVQRYYRPQCNFDNLIGKGRDEVRARCGVYSSPAIRAR
jgi:hypothetical protein